jgi:lipoyl(octanoyl) transferase
VSGVRRSLLGIWLGRRAYAGVHELQQRLLLQRQAGRIGDMVLLLEHEPVITLGRGAKLEHLLWQEDVLRARGIQLESTGRGGDITLHAPGQLVVYPILDLAPDRRDVRRYVRDLAETMRRMLVEYGVAGGPLDPHIGVWVDRNDPAHWPGQANAVDPAKIGAIGVRLSRWVAMHGFALNLTTDLELYRSIVPCGIRDHGVTSVAALTGSGPSVRAAAELALPELANVLDADVLGLDDRAALPLDQIEAPAALERSAHA